MKRLVAPALLVAACAEPATAPPPDFTFSVYQWIDDSVTHIAVDGADYPIVFAGGGKTLELTRTYPDYATARASAPITIELFAGSTVRRMGSALPGACREECPPSLCTPIEELRAEHLRLRHDTDFAPYEHSSMECVLDDSTVFGIE